MYAGVGANDRKKRVCVQPSVGRMLACLLSREPAWEYLHIPLVPGCVGLIGTEDPIVMLAVAEHRTFEVRGQQWLSLFDSIPLASSLNLDLNVCQRKRQGNYTRDSVALRLLGYFFLFCSFLFFFF